jgi:predicted alpha/beta superfamily hydrolase
MQPIETIRWEKFPTQFIDPRPVDIWLPPEYHSQPERRFPVLYMHDGQNLFYPEEAFAKVDWGIVPAMLKGVQQGKIQPAIVVGIWNTEKRFQELLPWKPITNSLRGQKMYAKHQAEIGQVVSDGYLRFMVEELKPKIDAQFRTLSGPEETFVMGSSMGGLMSLYAICEYPHIFGGAGCISTHWPVLKQLMVNYLKKNMPDPVNHKLYFDYGTQGLDAEYEKFQIRVDEALQRAGYQQAINWITRKFEGDDHHERFWRKRVHIPLELFLAT